MAKEQGLSLNPVKISGTCGRLMCCLKYEQEAYQDLLRSTPTVNSLVMTPDGRGVVTDVNLLTGILHIRLESEQDAVVRSYPVKQVKVLRSGKVHVNRDELEKLKELEKE